MIEPERWRAAARIGAYQGARAAAQRSGSYVLEEAEGAALEALARRPPATFAEAVMRSRSAAIDEARRLTGWSRSRGDAPSWSLVDVELEAVDERAAIAAVDDVAVDRLTERQAFVVAQAVVGHTQAETAEVLGVTPGRVSQILTEALTILDANAK